MDAPIILVIVYIIIGAAVGWKMISIGPDTKHDLTPGVKVLADTIIFVGMIVLWFPAVLWWVLSDQS
jgi:hypothetical protein